jgi:AcrR family transcriptional regulator
MIIRESKVSPPDLNEATTRDKILNAAGEMFADRGFDGATVRAITERAGVNIASINYHFRDKLELYTRVVVDACAVSGALHDAVIKGATSSEERLRILIHSFLRYILDPDRPDWKRRLMARELATPTAALDELVHQSIRPFRDELLLPTLRELTGGGLGSRQLMYVSGSIMGQCLYYLQYKPMIDRLVPDFKVGQSEISEMTDHIVQFSLAGIAALTRETRQS